MIATVGDKDVPSGRMDAHAGRLVKLLGSAALAAKRAQRGAAAVEDMQLMAELINHDDVGRERVKNNAATIEKVIRVR